MIIEGLKLTLLGMSVVFAFLGLLVVMVNLCARLLKPFTEKEAAAHEYQTRRKFRELPQSEDKRRIMAVISASVSAHRAGRK
ncbi:MAG: sodium pump decarboxylase subunit gamma [Desulfobacteraceae bacterium]|nr:MAG: sodium pump decarboxylase subunit gamma [Desulfobacteraceae bacterium]